MSSQAVRALHKQLALVRGMIRSKHLQFIFVEPDAEKLTQWHFLFEGPPDSHYEGGFYHGECVSSAGAQFRAAASSWKLDCSGA